MMSSAQTPTTPMTPMPSATQPLQPTWHGFVQDTREALLLFEAVLQGQLNRVTRRPHDRERANLIRSGSVFIYEEGASGIKRWTDGVSWSPSRILNNFLIYRELEKPFPPGEKKRAKPKVKPPSSTAEEAGVKHEMGVDGSTESPATPSSSVRSPSVKNKGEKDSKRALVGSLTESYNFKEPGGLVKKTMSVVVQGSHFHLVSYYEPDDVCNGLLERPMNTALRGLRVRNELVQRQNFRAPIDEADEGMQTSPSWAQAAPRNAYMPTGTPTHAAFLQQQQEYLQTAGQHMSGGAMSPQSPSYPAQWAQQDPRTAYTDQRYAMSTSSPVQAQNPYLTQMSQMPPSMSIRTDFGSQYAQPAFGSEQYQQYQGQQRHPQQQQQQLSSHGQQYPTHTSPMQQSPGQAWPPR